MTLYQLHKTYNYVWTNCVRPQNIETCERGVTAICIAVSGILTEIDGTGGKVNIRGNVLPVELGLVNARVGDDILVHAGFAIAVLKKSEAEELDELFTMLDEYEK